METPMERARALVADCAKRGVQGHEAIARRNQARVLAIADAGLALRDACREAQNAGGTDYDFHRRMLDARDSYDAAIALAIAEGGE